MEKNTLVKVEMKNAEVYGKVKEVVGSQVYILHGQEVMKFHIDEVEVVEMEKAEYAVLAWSMMEEIAERTGVAMTSIAKLTGVPGGSSYYDFFTQVVTRKTNRWMTRFGEWQFSGAIMMLSAQLNRI